MNLNYFSFLLHFFKIFDGVKFLKFFSEVLLSIFLFLIYKIKKINSAELFVTL